jgi:N-acetyl-gamma-glutamyl-phosphate reductase
MTQVGVIGATGYAGAELVRILAGHPDVELGILTSRNYAGEPFSSIYPAMAGVVDTVLESYDIDRVSDRSDVVFTALPHKLPMTFIPELIRRGKKVVDLSADFRFQSRAAYESHYQPHTAPELLSRSVYGLSEVYFDAIRQADLIGNPGCYPTSVLLPLVPLLRKNMLDPTTLVADSKSGVSGAGRSPSLTTLYCGVTESFKPYKIAGHRHNPEMDEILTREAHDPVHITFVPHLVPMSRGMLTSIYAKPTSAVRAEDIRSCLESYYAGRPFVRLTPEDRPPNTLFVRGTNFCDIGFKFDAPAQRLILISAIDNLVKGAAGQAVQNMNIMLGLDETAGLSGVPYPL